MNAFRTTTSSIGLLLVVVYAVGAGLWTSTGDGWYQSLNAPTWQPPDWIYRASLPLLICLVPYQVWLITANFLSWGYQKRN